MTFACDAIVSDGSREWRLGPLVASPTKVRAGHGGPSVPLDGIAPNQEFVTIRLVPSRDAAREFLGVFRFWGGEIVRERVKVHWQHARDSFSAIGAG